MDTDDVSDASESEKQRHKLPERQAWTRTRSVLDVVRKKKHALSVR
jgi:hypothetical protein